MQTKEWAPQLHLDLLGDVGGAETSSRAAEATRTGSQLLESPLESPELPNLWDPLLEQVEKLPLPHQNYRRDSCVPTR